MNKILLSLTHRKIFLHTITVLMVTCVTLFLVAVISAYQKKPVPESSTKTFEQAPFVLAPIQAESVLVYDMSQNAIVYEKGADVIQPLASLTKIMTALVALKHASPDREIVMSARAIQEPGNNFLNAGEAWELGDLVAYMLITSSNDAAYEIAESLEIDGVSSQENFVEAMNTYAREIGLSTLRFKNPSGLDIEESLPSATGSARDIVRLLSYASEMHPDVFGASATHNMPYYSKDQRRHIAENTNILAQEIPSLMASKTGFTNTAGGNLAFIFEVGPSRPFGVVIIGSTFQGRFDDAERLIKATRMSVQQD